MRFAWLFLLLAPAASAAEPQWIRLSSPTVDLFTDGSDNAARAVLNRLDQLRRIFGEATNAESSSPLRVFVFHSDRDFAKYRPDAAATAFYRNDDGQDFIVLSEGGSVKWYAAHEYLHVVVKHTSTPLPHWLEEGLAEFYSSVSIHGDKLHVGQPLEYRLNTLATRQWMDAESLALGSHSDGSIFYAESWALVHMLSLDPDWRHGLPQFVKFLGDGLGQGAAFQKAFGASMGSAIEALHSYTRRMRDVTLPAPPFEDVKISAVARLDPAEAALALAGLALQSGHQELAHTLYERIAKNHPQSPSAIAGLGFLALTEDRKADAEARFEEAIAQGVRDANVFFQLAALRNDNALLEKAIAADPNFADAYFLLGTRATDAGNYAIAIDHLKKALAIRPRRFTYWHALAYAEAKSGDRAAAAESARHAVIVASNTQEEEMAAALSGMLETAAPHDRKPSVVTPATWRNPKGDTRVEGKLTRVDCEQTPVRLTIAPDAAGKPFELQIENPAAVELVNAEGAFTTLVCGEQSRPLAVEFTAASKNITRIEFRPVVIIKR